MKSAKNCKNIKEIRVEIDRIDKVIISTLAERLEYVTEAAKFKSDIESVLAPDRHIEMLAQRLKLAETLNLDPVIIEKVYEILLNYYKQKQLDIWNEC